ncbi:P-loop containing nucleoside triphosphate hydrolase protein [Aspergillus crustosus]
MDLLSILPNFSVKPYAHILPPLERSRINTVDLISLNTLEIAKRAHVPPADVRRLANNVIKALHRDVGFEEPPRSEQDQPDGSLDLDIPLFPGPLNHLDLSQWCAISTLDATLDNLLKGGIPTGYVTEVTGESGSGKTQFLLNLLLAVQLPPPRGASKGAIYISTEAPLATNRLSQLIESHPSLSSLPRDHAPSLERILSINAMDLESQDHILNYQLPVAIERYNVGLVVIDSITSNYRAEHTSHDLFGLSTRSGELAKIGQMLRNLAASEDIAIVVANQVSDRFEGEVPLNFPRMAAVANNRTPMSSPAMREYQPGIDRDSAASSLPRARQFEQGNVELNQHYLAIPQSTPNIPSSSPLPTQDEPQQQSDGSYLVGNPIRNEILSLQHQQRFFTGWGDSLEPVVPSAYPGFQRSTLKTPTLGLVWTTQLACRIAMKKHTRSASFDQAREDNFNLSTREIFKNKEQYEDDMGTKAETHGSAAAHSSETRTPLKNNSTQGSARNNTTLSQYSEPPVERTIKLVFSPWAGGPVPGYPELQKEVEFEIWKGGLRAVQTGENEDE